VIMEKNLVFIVILFIIVILNCCISFDFKYSYKTRLFLKRYTGLFFNRPTPYFRLQRSHFSLPIFITLVSVLHF